MRPRIPRVCSLCGVPLPHNTKVDKLECPDHVYRHSNDRKVCGIREGRNIPFGVPLTDVKARSGKIGIQPIGV